jgi:hypothetical protein
VTDTNTPEVPSNRRRWALAAVVVVVILVAGGWWLFNRTQASGRTQPSGDPGGKVLSQLAPAAAALPGYGMPDLPWTTHPSPTGPYLIKSEPKRDSCGGRPGTEGWGQVVLQGNFRWPGSHSALVVKVGSGLGALGWNQTPIPGQNEAIWKKVLNNGSIATAMLSLSPLGDPDWEFVALAPPVGKAASGC